MAERIPPIYLEEIILLNEEINRLVEENKELKDKLHEIHCIARGEEK